MIVNDKSSIFAYILPKSEDALITPGDIVAMLAKLGQSYNMSYTTAVRIWIDMMQEKFKMGLFSAKWSEIAKKAEAKAMLMGGLAKMGGAVAMGVAAGRSGGIIAKRAKALKQNRKKMRELDSPTTANPASERPQTLVMRPASPKPSKSAKVTPKAKDDKPATSAEGSTTSKEPVPSNETRITGRETQRDLDRQALQREEKRLLKEGSDKVQNTNMVGQAVNALIDGAGEAGKSSYISYSAEADKMKITAESMQQVLNSLMDSADRGINNSSKAFDKYADQAVEKLINSIVASSQMRG